MLYHKVPVSHKRAKSCDAALELHSNQLSGPVCGLRLNTGNFLCPRVLDTPKEALVTHHHCSFLLQIKDMVPKPAVKGQSR